MEIIGYNIMLLYYLFFVLWILEIRGNLKIRKLIGILVVIMVVGVMYVFFICNIFIDFVVMF